MQPIITDLIDKVIIWIPRLLVSSVIFLIFLLVSKIVKKIINSNSKLIKINENLLSMITGIAGTTIIIFGIVTALGTIGINVTAVVAGLGLTGFAIGFALKDTISNILSGILILIYHPFIKGDKIKISGLEGIVRQIDLRYTELESNGEKILIPNSKIFTEPITVINLES
ncbi:MAG: mechanosensitive ion channel [Spirochaetaceae bacterium]|jgi:small conductance mechanosensitive channel|nr:mechanosensitive ion channel [Spirochaetaceae bacterium]